MDVDGQSLRVLGIDPGSLKAGWGLVDVHLPSRRITHVDNGAAFLDQKAPLPERLLQLSQALVEVVDRYRPSRAAVEDVFVRRSARSALILGQARGAAVAVLGLKGLLVTDHTAPEVKARVTGRGRATKEQVAEMVRIQLDLPEVPFEDAADALAVALCHALTELAPPGAVLDAAAVRTQRTSPGRRRGRRETLADLARAQGKI